MNCRDTALFAAVMTLIDELKDKEYTEDCLPPKSSGHEIDINFSLDDMSQAKNTLISLANQLFARADEAANTTTDNDSNVLVSSLIAGIIYESVHSIAATSETKGAIYGYALDFCSVDTDFTWKVINADRDQMEGILKDFCNIALDSVFVASTVSNSHDLCTDFVRWLTFAMLETGLSINRVFDKPELSKKPLMVTLDYIVAGMEREKQRLEKNDPSLKEQKGSTKDNGKMNSLREKARNALDIEDMNTALECYNQITEINASDWEATFYKVICSAYKTADKVNTRNIEENAKSITSAMTAAMNLAKNQILVRQDLILALGKVCSWLCKLASSYFVATMNEYKASVKNAAAQADKANRVCAVMQMLFESGDAIEQNFGNDTELCKNLCVACWEIAFHCYENCNMRAPQFLNEYYQKLRKYMPTYTCSKPVVSQNTGGDGCYVATAVYGSYDCPQVWVLRRFRDYSLRQCTAGRTFIRLYYATSPTFVKLFGRTKWFNNGCRKLLDSFVNKLMLKGYKNDPYTDETIKVDVEEQENG